MAAAPMTPPRDPVLSRRKLLATATATLVASSCGEPEVREPPARTAAEARTRLEAGNRRFVTGTTRHAHEGANWRKMLTAEQHPFATLLCCSDSRVPPELVFDQGFGELFVIRIAGNVIAADVIGSMQYAVRHLATPLIVVMGHEGCGAVAAAIAALGGAADEPRYITELVERIEPGLAGLAASLEGEARALAAVEANVRWSIKQLADLPETRAGLQQQVITLAGAVYELATGVVRFLE